jgi:hypothetical protein
MLPLCPGSATPAHITGNVLEDRVRRRRMWRVVLMVLLFGLIFLPIFLEVASAFEGAPRDDEASPLLTSRKTLDFGARFVGATTPIVSLAIANSSGSNVPISKVAIDGANAADFALVSSTCETLAPNEVCTVVTRFTPKGVGARTARLLVSIGEKSAGLEIPMVGQGVDAAERRRSQRPAKPYR